MTDHVRYDPALIQTFADRLYAEADSIVRSHMMVAGFVGLFFGGWLGAQFDLQRGGGPLVIGVVVGAVVLALAGRAMAEPKVLALRLSAQTALCQVQIETNTRRGASSPVAPPPLPPAG